MLTDSSPSKPNLSHLGNQMTHIHHTNVRKTSCKSKSNLVPHCHAEGSVKLIVLLLLGIIVASGVTWYVSQNGGSVPGKTETKEIDPKVLQYYEKIQPVVKETRHLQALREVGGNYKEHKDALIALKAAYNGSGIKDIDSRDPWVKTANENHIWISAFNANMATVLIKFDTALAAWGDAINAASAVSRVEAERERDINFRAGDKDIAEALDCYADIEREVQ